MLLAIPDSMNAWTTCHHRPVVFSPARTFHFSEALQVAAATWQTAWSVWRQPPAVPGVVHEAHGGERHQTVAQVSGALWAGFGRAPLRLRDNPPREARQTAAGAVWETWHWRNVRTAQDSAAANGCPPRGEDQSNRDESGHLLPPGVVYRGIRASGFRLAQARRSGASLKPGSHPGCGATWVKRAISARSNTK